MRSEDRRSAFLITLVFSMVSCAIEPAVDSEPLAATGGPRGSDAVISAVGNDARKIERILAARSGGMLPAEIVHVSRVIAMEADRVGLPPSFVLAVIEVESNGHAFAESHVGALGLMQIMPATGEYVADQLDVPWDGRDTLLDPVVNVRLGIHYLQSLIERYGDVRTALAAYNAGPGSVSRRLRSGEPIASAYADKVLAAQANVGEAI